MIALCIALAALLVLDAIRMLGRLGGLKRLPTDVRPSTDVPELRFALAPGVELDPATRRAASAYCRAEGLEALDLVPDRLPALAALTLAALVDPRKYRSHRLARGVTAGYALGLTPELCERARLEPESASDPVALLRLASKAKSHACTRTDMAVVAGQLPGREDLGKRLAVTRELVGSGTPIVLAVQLIFMALLVLGVILPDARVYGLVAVGAYQLQPLVAILGSQLRSRDALLLAFVRLPWDLYAWIRTVAGRWRPLADVEQVEALRPVYAELLAGDRGRFFEPRRDDCPLCGGADLKRRLRARDLLQHKPGRFTLERCRGCGHIFQNPRLSLDGLDFYYKDFYDGLGERQMEMMFAFESPSYDGRAAMVKRLVSPARWLDVGTGHGHFCCKAQDHLPDTRFEGLDLNEAVLEAERRGWIARAHRGLFPDLAPELAGAYDVVSMHHYLEHTRQPADELDAARTALCDDGHLLIELPDPSSWLGRLLGRYWMPWFQPQHQHFLSRPKLDELLRQRGFAPVAWERSEPHQPVDFTFAVFLFLDRLAPPLGLPWRPPPGAAARAWRVVVRGLGTPFIILARLTDQLLRPVLSRVGASNTFRVVARKDGPGDGGDLPRAGSS